MNEMPFRDKQNLQSGQALVEYVLLLVISIALVLGLARQLYRPFAEWLQDYMGAYVECLLDVGELPTIGGSSDSGECNTKFKRFSLIDGRPPVANAANLKADNDSSEGLNSNNSQNGGRGVSSSASSMRRSTQDRPLALGQQRGADGQEGIQGEGQTVEKLPDSRFFNSRGSSSFLAGRNGSSGRPGQTMTVPMSQIREKEKRDKAVKMNDREFDGPQRQAKKLLVKPVERAVAAEIEDQPWSFTQYIKIALIIVIIVAIILFLGGQILQISKSMEK